MVYLFSELQAGGQLPELFPWERHVSQPTGGDTARPCLGCVLEDVEGEGEYSGFFQRKWVLSWLSCSPSQARKVPAGSCQVPCCSRQVPCCSCEL